MIVEVHPEGLVLRVTLNRPEHRNLLTQEMAQVLVEAIEQGQSDPGVRAVLLAGAGDFFCYGGEADMHAGLWSLALRKPLIAAVRGAALGAGVALVAQSHVAVAAQGSSFGLLEIRNKTYPAGMTAVARAIGWRRATELALTGRVFSTPEALQMGLVHEIAPAFEYEERAESIAQLLAAADEETVSRILTSRPPMATR